MIIREIGTNEKEIFNQAANHPLQTWEWGQFRQASGRRVIRLGGFEGDRIKEAYQLTVHPIPKINKNILWFPRGVMPHQQMLTSLTKIGQENNAIYLKLEPNICAPVGKGLSQLSQIRTFLTQNGCLAGQEIFIKNTLTLDLTQTDEKLLAGMKPKTRYNLKIAQQNGVEVKEDNSPEAFDLYLKLTKATTQRQGFYAHTPEYHRQMWTHLQPTGLAHLLIASVDQQPAVAWILFKHKDTLYYPYGASSRQFREKMPAYAMMWAAIQFGKENHCQTFDLWGSLGPDPDPQDDRFGFHRFKAGFGTELKEFVGSYDLVINSPLYPLVRLAENGRHQLLQLKKKIRRQK